MDVFDYEHINLVPKKCIVNSRSSCNTSFTLGKYVFKMPVIPANMECVIDTEIAVNHAKKWIFLHTSSFLFR